MHRYMNRDMYMYRYMYRYMYWRALSVRSDILWAVFCPLHGLVIRDCGSS